MNITIKDKVGLTAEENLKLAKSLIIKRPPQEGSFNYGFETHGALGILFGFEWDSPIQVYQSNKRKSNKSPIEITIEKHRPI